MICQFRLLVCKLPNPKVTCFYLLRYQENHIFRKRKELQTTSSSGDFNVCVWGKGLTIKSNWILFDTARCFPTCLLPTLTLKVWSLGSSISIRGNLLKRHLLGPCPIKSEILEAGPRKLCFTSPPGDSDSSSVWEPLTQGVALCPTVSEPQISQVCWMGKVNTPLP